MIRKIVVVIIALIVFATYGLVIYGGTYETPTEPGVSTISNEKLEQYVADMWANITIIIQLVAVGVFAYAGLRYMFSSSDTRADIKKGLIYLAIGSVLVFSAVTIINFVIDVINQINS